MSSQGMESFADSKILVTGASRGIGRAIAQALAARGAVVALDYRSHDDAAAPAAVRASDGRFRAALTAGSR